MMLQGVTQRKSACEYEDCDGEGHGADQCEWDDRVGCGGDEEKEGEGERGPPKQQISS